MDYDDSQAEARWCEERRDEVSIYLQRQPGCYGQTGEWPAWHIAPYVSIWAIESLSSPGWVGWWAICGDLPTDHVSAATIKTPRDAVATFARRWSAAAEAMSNGRPLPNFSIGQPSEWPALASLLSRRAELLEEWAADETVWEQR